MSDGSRSLSRRDMLATTGSLLGGLALAAPVGAQGPTAKRPEPRLEPLFDMLITIQHPFFDVGNTPAGGRQIVVATGGWFRGSALRGTILPSGGDWFVQRPDGVLELDVRLALRTDDEQLIYARYWGILDNEPPAPQSGGQDGGAAPRQYWRITPVFETASPRYAWLNRIVTIGVGEGLPEGPAYTIYAVR
jgi:hypothetical protein